MPTIATPLTLYVDASCPLCAWEVRLLQGRSHPQHLRLVDISAAGFDPTPLQVSLEQLYSCLHAHSADGQWLTGIDATLHSWRAAGLGIWVAPLAFAPLRPLWQVLYKLFLRLRPHLAWLPAPAPPKLSCSKHCHGGEENWTAHDSSKRT